MAEPHLGESADLYELLQVSPRASREVIQAAYRVLARNTHPDRNCSPGAERCMRRLNEAYAILHDPEGRALYDLQRARARRHERSVVTGQGRNVTASEVGSVRVLPLKRTAEPRPGEDRFPMLSAQAVLVLTATTLIAAIVLILVVAGLGAATDEPLVYFRPALIEMSEP